MIYYAASNAYAQTIKDSCESAREAVIDKIVSNELLLLTHLKKNISYLSQCDKFLIDLNSVIDADNEIIEAVEMIRMMYPDTRVIILASTRKGTLIQQFLNMGIYNIITTSDFVVMKSEIEQCITVGKNYKDTIELKSVAAGENVIEHVEYKQNIYKVMIGIVGTQPHIGATHQAITLAAFLRKKGYRVAVVEVLNNISDAKILEEMYRAQPSVRSDYRCIRENYEEEVLSTGEFNLFGVDYFETQTVDKIPRILEKSYNFIILDFGNYNKLDMMQFQKCEFRFLVAGSHDWEIIHLQKVFNTMDAESYKQLHYFFNFHDQETRKMIAESMDEFEISEKRIHFVPLTNKNIFEAQDIPYYEEIFKEYFPEPAGKEAKKLSLFGRGRKKNGKK